MAFYDAENGRKVYFEQHQGSKCPVFLIHGWAMSGQAWVGTVDALKAAGHAVVVMDHRGCGRTDRDFADMSIDAIAGDVVGIANQLGLEKVVLNGWSLGGAIAAEAAARLGTKAGGLVLTCAASPRFTQTEDFPHGGQAADVEGIPVAMAANRAGFFHALTQSVFAKDVGQPARDWTWSIFMESGPDVATSLLGLIDIDQRALLAELDIPVLSIVGSADQVTPPEIGRAAAECARHGTLAVMEGCGHAPFMEDPEAYMAALLGFLDASIA